MIACWLTTPHSPHLSLIKCCGAAQSNTKRTSITSSISETVSMNDSKFHALPVSPHSLRSAYRGLVHPFPMNRKLNELKILKYLLVAHSSPTSQRDIPMAVHCVNINQCIDDDRSLDHETSTDGITRRGRLSCVLK